MIEQENNKFHYRIIQINKIMYSVRIRIGQKYSLEKEYQTEYIIRIGENIVNIVSNQFTKKLLYELLSGYPDNVLSKIFQDIQSFCSPTFTNSGLSFKLFHKQIECLCKKTNDFDHLAGSISYCHSHSRLIEDGKMVKQTSDKNNINIVLIPQNYFFEYQTNTFSDMSFALREWLDICNGKEKQTNDMKCIINAKAVAQLLNLTIHNFYVDMVASDNGIINQNMIHKKIFPDTVTLISSPEEQIFDREGNRCIEKKLIDHGTLNALIADENGCKKIKEALPGNLNLHSDIELDHYYLKLLYSIITEEIDCLKVLYFTNLNISKDNINGVLFFQQDGEIYKSYFSWKINTLFQNTVAIKNTFQWINGCFCPNLLYNDTMAKDGGLNSVQINSLCK